jgi:hypothetical protein
LHHSEILEASLNKSEANTYQIPEGLLLFSTITSHTGFIAEVFYFCEKNIYLYV